MDIYTDIDTGIDWSQFCEGHESPRGDRMGAEELCDGTCSREYREYVRIARLLEGKIVGLGGDQIGVIFDKGDHDQYVAVLEDLKYWIVTYEHLADTGQRDWTKVNDAPSPDGTERAAFRAAGTIAAAGEQQ